MSSSASRPFSTTLSRHRPAGVATCALVLAAALAATNAGVATATVARKLMVGARSADTTFANMDALIGPVKVTRAFYPGTLPTTFATGDVTTGVKIIVSYKTPSANTALYVKSIPAGVNVELAYHHEPEGPTDYAGDPTVAGPVFVKEFNAEAAVIHNANPAVRVAFIGGGYQYQGGTNSSRGIGGYFIPGSANDYYLDSYQRSTITPAQKDPRVQNFIAELTKKSHHFNGFTEYGRGVIASGATFSQTIATARANVIKADATYLASLPDVDVWAYWYTTDIASGDQWRFTDTGSINAWQTVENANG